MRKATYYIDDIATLKRVHGMKDDDFVELKPFKAIYTLINTHNDRMPDRYELIIDGKKANINDLNGYQRGWILNDCWNHFMGIEPKGGHYMFEKVEEVI